MGLNKHLKLAFSVLFFYLNLRYSVLTHKAGELSRNKRTLVWEKGRSRLQIITGFGTPVDLKIETVIIAAIIKGWYFLPSNSSDLKPFGNVYYERKKRALSRWDIYDYLSQLWQMRGLGGKSCILRTICELSHKPVDKNYGLFDELIHAIFNPRTTKEPVREHSDNEYYAAEKMGRKNGEFCLNEFPDCPIDIVDLFTVSP